MRIRVSQSLILAALLASAPACVFLMDDTWTGEGGMAYREYHKVVPFEPKGALTLKNLDGDIEIRGWDKNEVEIVAESERNEGRRAWPFTPKLGRPVFDVVAEAGSLTIGTSWEGDDRSVYPVHYFLSVPRSIDIRDARTGRGNILIADLFGKASIQIQDGDLTVENYSGSLLAQVWRGGIQAEVLDLRPDDEVRLSAKEGDITLALEEAAAIKFEAEASEGVTSEFDLRRTLPAPKVSASLGAGPGAVVNLQAPNGTVELKKTH